MPDGLLLMVVEGLAFGNLLVGALNLVPGLPLDGGRVLKAAVWQLTGSVHRGTVVAAWGGRVTAFAVLLWPVAQEPLFGIEPDLFDFLLAFVIGFFLWNGATAALQTARSGAGCRTWWPATSPAVPSPCPRTCRWPRPYAARVRPTRARSSP